MNSAEYAKWEQDAALALSGRYTPAEIKTLLDWFRCIKGADEIDLIGAEAVEAMLVFTGAMPEFDLYSSLMARLFVYAPLILAEEQRRNTQA